MKKAFIFCIGLLLISGCTFNAWYKDFIVPKEKLYPPKLHLLSLDMSKQDVVNAIGEPDQVIGAKKVDGKAIDTWEYFRYEAVPGPDQIAERYEVQFTDGKLSSYESSGDYKQKINVSK